MLAILLASSLVGQTDPVFDLKAIAAPPLQGRVLKSAEKDGIVTEEVMFHSHKDGAKSVDIFALFSYPKGASKLPAFVWNQGGLGQAHPYWTEFGARRGYAVLCIDFPLPGYRSTGGYPINSGLELGDDPRQAPIYHGAVALLRAVSYLETRPEVDSGRIGMAGSSWGGFYTTLMAGVDPRLKAASCMFGCGSLELGNRWWDGQGPNPKRDAAFRKHWAATLDPALRLATSKTPIAWFTGTNDTFYWLPAVMGSYARAAGRRHLSLQPNFHHALTPALDDQVFAWLDVHLKGGPAFLTVSPVEIAGAKASWSFKGPRSAASAYALVSYGPPGSWVSRYWLEVPAVLNGQTVTATLPAASLPGFVIGAVVDDKGFLTSTPMVALAATDKSAPPVPAYNGCSMWSKFDPDQQYWKLHGWRRLPIADGIAQLPDARTLIAPLHGTQGVPHVLKARLLTKETAKVTFSLEGKFDGKELKSAKTFEAKGADLDIEVEFTPPQAIFGMMDLTILRSGKGKFALKDVRFEPKMSAK